MALRWIATQPIYLGPLARQVRAYNTNDIVPDETVTAHDLDDLGLVVRVDVPGAAPVPVVRPVTTFELVLSPSAPPSPVPGTVWIDTSPS